VRNLLLLLLLVIAASACATQGSAGPYHVDLKTDPAVIPVGRAKLLITVTDSQGKPVTGASVMTLAQMPGMPMGEREQIAAPGDAPGTYVAPAVFGMEGAYGAKITITGSLGQGETTLPLSTGENTQAGGGIAWTKILIWILVVGAILLVVRQVRRIGQGVNWRAMLNRQVLWSIFLLGIALAIAVWAVNTKRRPGAMTPLEAQVMNMNEPAPEGTLPVQLATVQMKPFATTVSYTGQAAGFVEQEVVPRVTGSIVWMPYYTGDKVHKGQVLARLDTSQLDPMVSEKAAQSLAAEQAIGVAQDQYQQALAEVTQAESEEAIRAGAIQEAKANIDAARQEKASAESELAMAQANVVDAQAQVAAAEADRQYWAQELARTQQLYAGKAVSTKELQQIQSQAAAANAKANQAHADVDAANAKVRAARAVVSKDAAAIVAAQDKLSQAEAEHHAHMAHVQSAKAAAQAARQKISQTSSEAQQARAGLQGAQVQRGYAELKSEVDGVITQRLISPGVVVNPGQAIMRVAQISPIRLQANVPESDLSRIAVGALVKVAHRDTGEPPILARVTSVAPSVDPVSRTGIVEALYSNPNGSFLPGQYMSMEITIGRAEPSRVVPSNAVASDDQGTYVWVAEPAMNGEYTVQRKAVQVAGVSGDQTALRSGVSSGQLVVLSPPLGLTAQSHVVSAAAPVGQ